MAVNNVSACEELQAEGLLNAVYFFENQQPLEYTIDGNNCPVKIKIDGPMVIEIVRPELPHDVTQISGKLVIPARAEQTVAYDLIGATTQLDALKVQLTAEYTTIGGQIQVCDKLKDGGSLLEQLTGNVSLEDITAQLTLFEQSSTGAIQYTVKVGAVYTIGSLIETRLTFAKGIGANVPDVELAALKRALGDVAGMSADAIYRGSLQPEVAAKAFYLEGKVKNATL